MIIIGSRAIKYYFKEFRCPKDWDLIATTQELLKFKKKFGGAWLEQRENYHIGRIKNKIVEIWTITEGSSEELIANKCDVKINTIFGVVEVPQMKVIAAIKRSHLYWPNNLEKHIQDYHFLRTFTDYDDLIFKVRFNEHKERLRINHVNLKMTNKRFFEKSQPVIKRIFDHDDLHKATCYYEYPLYKRCKFDNTQATIEQSLFNQLCHSDKIRMVKEECYALALERVIVPIMANYGIGRMLKTDRIWPYKKWLMKLITSVSSGWFREFVIENYPTLKYPDKDYINEFASAYKNGKVRFYNQ